MSTTPEHEPDAFTEVILRRRTILPDGTAHGVEAGFSIPAAPMSGDLLHALAQMVTRFDQATAQGIAEEHGAEAGMAYLDQIAATEARWTEEA